MIKQHMTLVGWSVSACNLLCPLPGSIMQPGGSSGAVGIAAELLQCARPLRS